MTQRVITSARQANATTTQLDDFLDRLYKYLPAGIVGGWTGLNALFSVQLTENPVWFWVFFIIFLALTGYATYKVTQLPNRPTAVVQIVLALVAFVVWALSLGGPLEAVAPKWVGGALLIAYTVGAPLFGPAITPEEQKTA